MIRALAILLLLTTAAGAHDHYPPECCDGKDCEVVPCGDIKQIAPGKWQHGKVTFEQHHVRPPRDEQCHVCEWGSIPRCVFFPMGGTS